MVYTDDGIFCGLDKKHIGECIKELAKQFNITNEGDVDKYLGVKVMREEDGSIKLAHPHLIDDIINDMGFKENTKGKAIPALSSSILQGDEKGKPHDEAWEYQSIIGKLNFLEKSMRMDLAYAVHQAARFSSAPKVSHSAALRQIVRYLIATRDKGLILKPDEHRLANRLRARRWEQLDGRPSGR